MSTYTSNILFGAMSFPLIAFLITLPYMIYQYRKFGSIPWLRTLIVYSFVFYLLVAYYMVILPLPEDRSAVVPYAQTPQLMPFNFVHEFLAQTTFSFSDSSTWLPTLRNPYIYEAFFNVLLLVPLGMYLRYYFRRTWWQTLLIGFATTLFYEVSQITGLWGIYAHPYRLFDVDDLLMNTLGAMVGFWLVGPAMRALPDIRLVNEEAREAGLRASVTRRALSFIVDLFLASIATGLLVTVFDIAGIPGIFSLDDNTGAVVKNGVTIVCLLLFFVGIPTITRGQTLGQKLLRLRIVRHDAAAAHWYHYLGRYGLLYLFITIPLVAFTSLVSLDASSASEAGTLITFAANHQRALLLAWIIFMGVWGISLAVRTVRAAVRKGPFVMLNGLLSNTRVMTEAGIEFERERRMVVDVTKVNVLEQMIAADGIPLSELMERAGRAVASEVRARVPDPAPVVVLAGAGNNGGDGWVAARELAEAGYPVTLIAPDLAERQHAEPARSLALNVFSDASERKLPLAVLIAPDADVLADTIDRAHAVVDALLGTGFTGDQIREPYTGWINAANRRRFEGARGKGRGRHRKRLIKHSAHEQGRRRSIPTKTKDAPFSLSIDVPSGLSAQTGCAAWPCFAADMTITMLAFKPGLVEPEAKRWTGTLKLAKLVETKPYLDRLNA